MISLSALVARTPEHVAAPVGEELAMMDIDSGRYYMLDEVAALIWTRLAEPMRVSDLVSDLGERYDVTPDRCEADLLPFLSQLHDKGLLRVEA